MLGTLTKPASTKPKQKTYADDNPLEALRHGVSDTASDFNKDFWAQLLGEKNGKGENAQGDMQEGQEINLKQHAKQEEKPKAIDADPGIDYRRDILHGERRISSETQQEVKSQIQQIQAEIQKLLASSQELTATFKDVVMMPTPVKAGKYHVNFFSWVLSAIKLARMKVEDSANCLAMVGSKGKKKNSYWGMFKQHGTSFGMSNERQVATQAG